MRTVIYLATYVDYTLPSCQLSLKMAEGETLVCIAIAPEFGLKPVYQLGTFLFRKELTVKEARTALESSDTTTAIPKKFQFLSHDGFCIESSLEAKVPISDILVGSNLIYVRILFERTRIGIRLKVNENDFSSIGFIFCSAACTLEEFRAEMRSQLTHLPASVHSAVLLDHNLWPVAKHQECDLSLMDVLINNEIHMFMHQESKHPILNSEWKPPDPMDPNQHVSSQSYQKKQKHSTQSPEKDLNIEEVNCSVVDTLEAQPDHPREFDVLISYVRMEASNYATKLKEELVAFGFSVFLDTDEIYSGLDWQDCLNDAISSCKLFVALITPRYGETLWTNREIKLADILAKTIIPINFLSTWPPKCLAIQFATTQFVPWKRDSSQEALEAMAWAANQIAEKYKHAGEEDGLNGPEVHSEIIDKETPPQRTVTPQLAKVPTLRSCPTALPNSTDHDLVQLLRQPREGKEMVVLISHPNEVALTQKTTSILTRAEYEVWEMKCCSEKDKSIMKSFQQKADDAGVVVILITKELASSSLCKEQIFYCEQRKRIVPVISGNIQMPSWLSMLIGSNTFVQAQSATFEASLRQHIEKALHATSSEEERYVNPSQEDEKTRFMKNNLIAQLPSDGKHVYISGSTVFFSDKGEEICKELGKALAQQPDVLLITGGFYGVGDTVGKSFYAARRGQTANVWHITAVRDPADKSAQTRQNEDGSFQKVPYGETIFIGDSIREREALVAKVLGVCVLIEGGPGAAYEAEQFAWNGGVVIPVRVTGGAAEGNFNTPDSIFECPCTVDKKDWETLGDKTAAPEDIALAIVRIIQSITGSGCGVPTLRLSQSFVSSQRSPTAPSLNGSCRKRRWSNSNSEELL